MVLLLVAHCDDEVIWFDPAKADKIVIVFLGRADRPWFELARRNAIKDHPLKDKIDLLEIPESNYWRDSSQMFRHTENLATTCQLLKKYKPTRVITHNQDGEYGHEDHKLVHQAAHHVFDCKITYSGDFNKKLHDEVKAIYKQHGCWTWH